MKKHPTAAQIDNARQSREAHANKVLAHRRFRNKVAKEMRKRNRGK